MRTQFIPPNWYAGYTPVLCHHVNVHDFRQLFKKQTAYCRW